MQTLVTLAATAFLVLGLWLPIASRLWCVAMTTWSDYLDADFTLAHPFVLIGWVVVLPIAAAIVLTRFEHTLSRRRITIGIAIASGCALAIQYGASVATSRCLGRMPAVDCPSLVYVSFVHLLLAAGLVACASLLGLAVMDRRTRALGVRRPVLRYLAFIAIVGAPNLIAVHRSFGFDIHRLKVLFARLF